MDRNRLDHYIPQGYLEGFIHAPGKGQLSVFDRQESRWFESGTAGVGAIRGFYDYTKGSQPEQTADEAFNELEAEFPVVRRLLVANGFARWKEHLGTLLAFLQMLRARSLFFRQQGLAQARNLAYFRIEEILPSEPSKTEPGKSVIPIRYSPYVPSEAEFRNKTITEMRVEIAKGAAWMNEMHWCLRVTQDSTSPFVTCDVPAVMEGKVPPEQALRDSGTLIFFPLCWQACLVGSPARFDHENGALDQGDMRKLRALYLKSAVRFVFSPIRIECAT